jgi:hypothetical protein
LDPVRDLFAKRIRKMTIENSLLIKNKIIVPIKRERTLKDRLIYLKDNKECPGIKLNK